MKYPVLCACSHSGVCNLNSIRDDLAEGWLTYFGLETQGLTTTHAQSWTKETKTLMRPLYCKIKNGEWGYNGAFCLSRGFFAMIFEPTGTWFLSLICPRIEHVSVTCWGYTNIQTISVVYALACLANVSKWERELLHSSFLLSLRLSWPPRAETIAAGRSLIPASKNWFYSSVKPSKHVKKLYLIG